MKNETFKILGLKEITDALKELPIILQARILKSFLRKLGNKFIVSKLKSDLNYSSVTESHIKVVDDTRDKLAIYAGVSTKGYRLRFADKGTVERETKKGYNRGKIIGKNQIIPTILSQVEPMIEYTREELGNEISKNLERRIKKVKKLLG